MNPKITLATDKEWSSIRPIPTEPTRWGKVYIHDQKFVDDNNIVNQYLERTKNLASYFNPEVTKKLLRDFNIKPTSTDNKLLQLSKQIQSTDAPTSWILNSLIFNKSIYKFVENHIQTRLLSSTLGPNREFPKTIFDYLIENSLIKKFQRDSKKESIKILDPCAGGGALGYVITEFLENNGVTNFHFTNADLSKDSITQGKKYIKSSAANYYSKYKNRIKYITQDATILDKEKNNSIDLIITMRALHEFTEKNLSKFFKISLRKLKPQGTLLCIDVTREKTILKRAETLLPLLGKFSAFMIMMKQFEESKKVNQDYLNIVMNGDPLLAQAGVQSYRSGYLAKELEKIARQSGVASATTNYCYDPPIGSVTIAIKKV